MSLVSLLFEVIERAFLMTFFAEIFAEGYRNRRSADSESYSIKLGSVDTMIYIC